MIGQALLERVRRQAVRVSEPLDALVARGRLSDHKGPVTEACAFEALFGGLRVGSCELGLDTHRRHPPRDAHDEWLDPAIQRELVQVAYEGARGTTYWLDRRGWVHAIEPLDRLRVHAERVDEFLGALTGGTRRSTHVGVVALGRCSEGDADALFGSRVGCPVGGSIVRWPPDAMDGLEERAWLQAELAQPFVVLSASNLAAIAAPLAEYLSLEPTAELVLLDQEPWPLFQNPIVDVAVEATYRIAWHPQRVRLALGRDADGCWHAAHRP